MFFEIGKGLGKQTDSIGEDNLDAMQKVQLQISHFANAFFPKTQTLRSSMAESSDRKQTGRLRSRHLLHHHIILLQDLAGLPVPPPDPDSGLLLSHLGHSRHMCGVGSHVDYDRVHWLSRGGSVGDLGHAVCEICKY